MSSIEKNREWRRKRAALIREVRDRLAAVPAAPDSTEVLALGAWLLGRRAAFEMDGRGSNLAALNAARTPEERRVITIAAVDARWGEGRDRQRQAILVQFPTGRRIAVREFAIAAKCDFATAFAFLERAATLGHVTNLFRGSRGAGHRATFERVGCVARPGA